MKRLQLPLLLAALFFAGNLSAQIHFSNKTHLLTPAKHYSGVAIAVLDMNGDGHDDIVRMNQGFQLAIEYQAAPNQPFTHLNVGPVPSEGPQWGICSADIDNNGFPDVLTGGIEDEIKVALANASGSAFTFEVLDAPETFTQCVNFADINNDGWLDAFVCHDDGTSRIFKNDGAGNLTYQPGLIDLATVPPSDNSGNYGSVWSDVNNDGHLDLYIAKCRQGVSDPADPMRINQLFLNNGDGTYLQDTTNASGLRIGAQSWTADFGDIDNDGDFDCFITNHDVSSQLLENDGAGHFTDISVMAGIFDEIGGFTIQGIFRDFDNDGFVDIFVTGTEHYLLQNNGDKTFSIVANLFDEKQIESCAIGDLNSDGFQDIYAVNVNDQVFDDETIVPDVLWMNDGNDNHFFGLNLRGVQSNRNAVGAKVQLHSALGIQTREVRSGESYGIMNSMQIHFGLGQTTMIDSVKVFWPSGTVDVLFQPALDQYLTLEEGGCSIPALVLTADGATTFCEGDSVMLTAPGGFAAYEWASGGTDPTFTAKNSGNFSVTVTNAEGCTAVSNIVCVLVDPDETPIITASGDTTFCGGGSVTLTASTASSYTWSTGANTQSITVTESGSYSVTTTGLCKNFTSVPTTVTVLNNAPPTLTGDTIAPGQTATLLASGDSPSWFDTPTGGNPFFTGNIFNTPPLDENVTYWVSNTKIYDQPNQFTGMTNFQGNTQIGDVNVNGAIIFDCFTPVRLAKVKVYANTPGERKIDLWDNQGIVVQSKTVNIPSGTTVISLDFDIPAGTDLTLTTDINVNFQNLGSYGPRLYRSTENVNYPYVIPGFLSIKNSNSGSLRYFYFFDWEVDFYEYECTSDRAPVTAVVDSTLSTSVPEWASGLRLFPNPTSDFLTVEIENFSGGEMSVWVKNAQNAVLKTKVLNAPSGQLIFREDLTSLPKGVYWLEFATQQGLVRRKVVAQ
ncbi:MAG: hypothetical protein OHK0019_28110 [Saprospiraceae bacterium]